MQTHHVDFKRAMQIIGVAQPATAQEREQIRQARLERQQQREQAADAAHKARRERLDVREEVLSLVQIVNEAANRLDRLHEAGMDESEATEREWEIMALAFAELRESENEYMRLCGLESRYE